MANPEHVAELSKGAKSWNAWRLRNGDADLSEVDLCDAALNLVNLAGCNLFKANLRGTELYFADLSEANLEGANLEHSKLTRASLYLADLRGASFVGANLAQANLSNATLDGAKFAGALFTQTVLAHVNLATTSGLDACLHLGPSSIGIDTLLLSRGEIPEEFLRGCGVPEQFITFARSLVGQAIQFYSCFISYSSYDQAFAERLHADLVAKGLRCWFAPEDLKIGDRFQERIEESIRLFDKVMIVLSEASVQSAWVEREVNAAWEREKREKRTVLFPIRIDDTVMHAKQPWAADIRRSRHIGDFRAWETHSSYLKALDRLLRDLKAMSPLGE